jgi:hypothetical protein
MIIAWIIALYEIVVHEDEDDTALNQPNQVQDENQINSSRQSNERQEDEDSETGQFNESRNKSFGKKTKWVRRTCYAAAFTILCVLLYLRVGVVEYS